MGYICPREWNSWHRYGSRGLPLKILQFFKDLIKNKWKNKSKLKVKWNVTAKQRKKNDWKWNEVAIKFKSKSNCIIKVKIISKLNWNPRAIHGERLLQSFFTQSKQQSFSCSCGQRTFPVMHDALNSSLACSMMTITATVVEQLFIRCFYLGREQRKLSMVCWTWDTNNLFTTWFTHGNFNWTW